MHEKEFSRKSFVKGGGALVVGFSVLGAVDGKAQAATGNTPFAGRELSSRVVATFLRGRPTVVDGKPA